MKNALAVSLALGKLQWPEILYPVGGMKKNIGIQCSEAPAKAFFRTISVPMHETLSFLGIDARGDILNHPDALTQAYQAGKALVSH